MSLSHTVKKELSQDSSADLTRLDLIYAALLHLLVIIVAVVLAYWQNEKQDEPLQRIEVMMISAQQLSEIEHMARRKAKPVKQEAPKPKATEKPKVDPKKEPVLKLEEKPKPKPKAEPKPEVKAAPAPKAAAKKQQLDFDPFAPIASTTDRSAESRNKASTSRPDIANIAGQQLSRNEIERYIALMQAAVQEHWKVPASSSEVTDPLVEMELSRTGEVVSVKIMESSGNDMMDASLIRAIQAAAPFQLPKEQFEYFRVNQLRFRPLK
ncbi:TonB family C-terminal domain-containing protein [Mariprofundus ferrinatatus]|uniref:TonB family C-terminal domain-containing protein n=1 Tax=Mariprofundus ferrinatatus TaxID=1921087 RepID=A0A2K8L3S4_9PROT|nr:TonB family protein [Mariprofundus ferrinatatus]ATX81937.1 TonB family C-terminal domain-containing protein [Mariprofundus ferrinatatus]